MTNELTPAETRFVRALNNAGPLGIAPLGLARALGLSSNTVVGLSLVLERKGYCTRERYGMRVFLRPTAAAQSFVASSVAAEEIAES